MKIEELEKSPKQYYKVLKLEIKKEDIDLQTYFQNNINDIKEHLKAELQKNKGLKVNNSVKVNFGKVTYEKHVKIYNYKEPFLNSKSHIIINENDIESVLKQCNEEVINKISEWLSEGSGWTVNEIIHYYINLIKYKPLRGSTYIDLPAELKNAKKGLLNIQNKNDNECFRWCHLAFLNPTNNHAYRISKYKQYINELNYSGINFPVTIKQIPKIEQQNNIRFNIFGYENKQIFPLHISTNKDDKICEMLLITKDSKSHYVWIKDFNRLMYNQTNHKEKKYFCKSCLQCFSSEGVLQNHTPNCLTINGKQTIKMPNKGEVITFKNYHKQLMIPFVIYADFEALTIPVETVENNPNKSYTKAYQKHEDCGFGYKVVCCYDDNFTKPVKIYRGKNAVYEFLKQIIKEEKECIATMKNHFNKDLTMTAKEESQFQKASFCHICNKRISGIKVRDHCHVTGKFRGAAHESCNINFRLTKKIPVIFHNLRGYDSHFIMQHIGKFNRNINVIPNNMEKYMAFMFGKNLVFIDSFQFMSQSLDSLVKNQETLKYTKEEFGKNFDLMKRKGVYMYDYMDSFDKFNEKKLPLIKDFYSKLNDEHISDEDYFHAKKIWKTFNIKSLGEYHDLYLKTDVLLLADVFENFRKTSVNFYKLDPSHYFSSAGLAWDACLKMTGVTLDLLTDVDKHLFIEKGTRGGISYIANRYSKANNKYLNDYNPKKESKYIMYLDANNLYGYAMSQNLPTGNFKWVTNVEDDFKKGKPMILEVDLEYPKNLHNLHNDYPLAPEKIEVSNEWLSDYQKNIKEKFKLGNVKVKKLIPTLFNKKKYVLHYKNLELYLKLGLKLKKIHRALSFNESPWLKKYIDFNTEQRKIAKNSFEKDFFKLMNNSVFGKTMENLRKRVNVKLTNTEEQVVKHASKPSFVSCKMFNKNLYAVNKIKESLLLNRPCYVGMCILDLSKVLMYDFYYSFLKNKYKENCMFLFGDTDSLCCEIKTKDIYKDLYKYHKDLFDNSDYSPEHKYFFDDNKKVIGKMKDETAGMPISEFVGLRSKLYSYVLNNDINVKKCKGVKKCIVKKVIDHENYKNVLFNQDIKLHKMNVIRSKNHEINSYIINKNSLSCYDDKRYILDNGINTVAYGHKDYF